MKKKQSMLALVILAVLGTIWIQNRDGNASNDKVRHANIAKATKRDVTNAATKGGGAHQRTAKSAPRKREILPLKLPMEFRNKTARVGDTVQIQVGEQVHAVRLKTAAYMETGFTFEGRFPGAKDGESFFYLNRYNDIWSGVLVPSLQSPTAFSIRKDGNWEEKPTNTVACLAEPNPEHFYSEPIETPVQDIPPGGNAIPLLQSYVRAPTVLLLDFDDHQLDSSGNPQPGPNPWSNYVTTEQMTWVWQKISENFIMFKMNVTTDESVYLKADPTKRARIVFANSGGGTVTWMGYEGGAFKNPADIAHCTMLVRRGTDWFNDLGILGEVTQTATHEIGHYFMLNHDGWVDDTGYREGYHPGIGHGKEQWCPIMGNTFGRRFLQWSPGDYDRSTNKESDFNIMLDNGSMTFRADDYQETYDAGAFDLIGTYPIERSGRIETRGDVDVFEINVTESGIAEIDAIVPTQSMLDIAIELLDAERASVPSSRSGSPKGDMNGHLRCSLAAGTYYLKVGPASSTLHSDYSTLGSYRVVYNFTPGAAVPVYELATNLVGSGSVKFDETQYVLAGDSPNIKIQADKGNRISMVRIDGILQSLTDDEKHLGCSHTFSNVQGNHLIQAAFEVDSEDYWAPDHDLIGTWKKPSKSVISDFEAVYGDQSFHLNNAYATTNSYTGYLQASGMYPGGELSFCYMISSSKGVFTFTLDGEVLLEKTAYCDWTRFTATIPDDGELHTLKWSFYSKSGRGFQEINEGTWIDELRIPGVEVPPRAAQGPFGGSSWQLPGKIEAEDYDLGGEGLAYHDTTSGNAGGSYRNDDVDIYSCDDENGGYCLGSQVGGEYVEYTVNVPRAGSYDIALRIASPASGGNVRIYFDGFDKTGGISLNSTGGLSAWETILLEDIQLDAGEQVMRVEMGSNSFNLNWIELTEKIGYDSWAAGLPGLTDTSPGADPDHDGMPNLLEYVLNGDPRSSDPAIQPGLGSPVADSFVFTFDRRTSSSLDTNQVFEYGTGLSFGQAINITIPTGPEVLIGGDVAGRQSVTITIPKDSVAADKIFGRLKVTQQ